MEGRLFWSMTPMGTLARMVRIVRLETTCERRKAAVEAVGMIAAQRLVGRLGWGRALAQERPEEHQAPLEELGAEGLAPAYTERLVVAPVVEYLLAILRQVEGQARQVVARLDRLLCQQSLDLTPLIQME